MIIITIVIPPAPCKSITNKVFTYNKYGKLIFKDSNLFKVCKDGFLGYNNNNNNNIPFLYSAYHIQMASLCARCIITPALAPPCSLSALRAFEGINSCWVPIYYTWGRERQLWTKCLCLRAYATERDSNPDPL